MTAKPDGNGHLAGPRPGQACGATGAWAGRSSSSRGPRGYRPGGRRVPARYGTSGLSRTAGNGRPALNAVVRVLVSPR